MSESVDMAQFDALRKAVSDAEFECGEWSPNNTSSPPYGDVMLKADTAVKALRNYVEGILQNAQNSSVDDIKLIG